MSLEGNPSESSVPTSSHSSTVTVNNPYAQKKRPVAEQQLNEDPSLLILKNSNAGGTITNKFNKKNPDDNSTSNVADSKNNENASLKLSVNLPRWERLPSHNLSFGSAEIVTVAECVSHMDTLKSVRTTGKLLYRYVVNENEIYLVVGDVFASTNRGNNASNAQVQNRKVISATSTARKCTSGLIVRRRPLSPTTPREALQHALQQTNTILVVVNPIHTPVDHSQLDDLVMVIGEVQNGSELDLPRSQFIQARIVRNANGTNVRLLQDAVFARRKYFKSINHEGTGCGHHSAGDHVV